MSRTIKGSKPFQFEYRSRRLQRADDLPYRFVKGVTHRKERRQGKRECER